MNIIKIFKALADETRLRIFCLLLHHEFNVNEMVQAMDMGQSRISRHLKILSESGQISSRRDGSFVYYHGVINEDNKQLIGFIQQHIDVDAQVQKDLDRAETIFLERKTQTARFFSRVAEYWEQLKESIFGDLDINSLIAEKAGSAEVVVDLGCGTGELIMALHHKADKVIGIDSSPHMLERAASKLRSNGHNVELRLGELEHLPMGDNAADTAVVNMVLHHLSVPASGIREAYRVLMPEGRFIIVDFDKHNQEWVLDKFGGPWMGFLPDDIEQWLKDAGFHLLEQETFQVKNRLGVNLFVAVKQE